MLHNFAFSLYFVIIPKLIYYYFTDNILLLDPNILAYSWIRLFFISISSESSKKNLLYDSLVLALNNFFLLRLLQDRHLCFLTFSIVFPKPALFINLKKAFSKSFFVFFFSSVFISMYGFNQDFWLNLMTLCIFFKTDSWFSVCCKVLMRTAYSFFHTSWLQVFKPFQFSFFLFKDDKSLRSLGNIFVKFRFDFKARKTTYR